MKNKNVLSVLALTTICSNVCCAQVGVNIRPIASSGRIIPVLGVPFEVVHAAWMNTSGDVGFSASIDLPVSFDSIWHEWDGQIDPIAITQQPITSLTGVNMAFAMSNGGRPWFAMNSFGQTAFATSVYGPSVNGFGFLHATCQDTTQTRHGIWTDYPDGVLKIVMLTGSTIQVAPQLPLTLAMIHAPMEMSDGQDGRPMAASKCRHVIRADFTDGTTAALLIRLGCRADFDENCVTDPDDLASFIACFFASPPCPLADFDFNGTVDPDDLSEFISAYFECAGE